MQLSNSLEIARDIEEVFDAFLDIEKVAGAMPGATLTRMVDDSNFEGEVKVQIGPLRIAYAGSASLIEVDRDAKKLGLRARGRESSGAGNADALVHAQLIPTGTGTRVEIQTDLSIRGKVAQFGGGAIGEVSASLMQQFARNVEQMLTDPARSVKTTAPADLRDESNSITTVPGPTLKQAVSRLLPVLAVAVAAYFGARLVRQHSRRR